MYSCLDDRPYQLTSSPMYVSCTGGNYSVWELVLFILVGSIGGLVGAWFNGTNERLSIFRAKNIKTRGLRGKQSEPHVSSLALLHPPVIHPGETRRAPSAQRLNPPPR